MLQASDEFWADEHETFVDVAAQDTKESAQHIPQQANTAICPKCGSGDIVEYIKPPVLFVCNICHAIWGKQQ